MTTPLRSRIAKAFNTLVSDIPEITWRKKSSSPILRIQPQECPAFYTFDFQEQVIEESEQTNELVRAKLFIILEFWVHTTLSDDSSDMLNDVLWKIQKTTMKNKLGGLVQRISEVGSKFKVESAENRIISAEVAFQITYVRRND